MNWITTLDDLHAHYGQPAEAATVKVTPHLTPAYRAWLDRVPLLHPDDRGPGRHRRQPARR